MLTAAITFANPIDFDKAFKESKKIEKQIMVLGGGPAEEEDDGTQF